MGKNKNGGDEPKKMTTHEDLMQALEEAKEIAARQLQEIADAEARRAAMHVVPPTDDDEK